MDHFRCFLLAALGALLLAPAPLAAQELLANRSFENPVVPANGNNFYATLPGWTITNVTPAQAVPANIVRPFAGYTGNPTSPPTGGGVQYFDVNAAAGIISQTVAIPSTGMVDFSGWFSVRDNQQALGSLTINLRDPGGTIIATVGTSFVATDPVGLWKQAGTANVPVSAGNYTLEVIIPNPANFDLASLVFKPALTLSKTSAAWSDPQNGVTDPKAIPGGVTEYQISAASPASYSVTNDTISVTDTTPAGTDLVVSDIGGAGTGPAAFTSGSSSLSYGFTTLGSLADDIEFSSDSGASWAYAPVAGPNGTDPAVTHVRLRPKGAMTAGSSFSFRLRYRIR